jgi:hypothetical protein
VFGYILTGVTFLLIGIHSGHIPRFGEFCKICGPDLTKWMAGLLLLIVSYVAGHFVVATTFFIPDVVRLIGKRLIKKGIGKEEDRRALDANNQEASDLLRYRRQYPDIFIELDRRSILALLRTGLAGSVIVGLAVFYWLYPYWRTLMVLAGVVMLFNAYGGNRHVREMRRVTLKAAQDADMKRSSESTK